MAAVPLQAVLGEGCLFSKVLHMEFGVRSLNCEFTTSHHRQTMKTEDTQIHDSTVSSADSCTLLTDLLPHLML